MAQPAHRLAGRRPSDTGPVRSTEVRTGLVVVLAVGNPRRRALAWAWREVAITGETVTVALLPPVAAQGLADTGQELAALSASVRLLVLGRGGTAGSLGAGDRESFGAGGWSAIVRSAVTTVVVPEVWHDRVAGPVVVGVDGSRLSRAALEFGFRYASAHGLDVTAIHATGSAEEGWQDWSPPESGKQDPERLLAGELAAYRIRYPRVRVTERVSGRPVTVAVVDAAAQANLLVVGAHGNGPPLGALGSLARTAVGHARCPVAVVRL